MTRVAVLISGQPRFGRTTTELMKTAFVNFDRVDWFFSLWRSTPLFQPTPWGIWGVIPPGWENINVNWAIDKIMQHMPGNQFLQSFELLDVDNLEMKYTSKQSVFHQFYSIHKTDILRQNFEKSQGFTYDYVIRIRPDIIFDRPINIEHIPTKCIGIVDNRHSGEGNYSCNDFYAIGGSKDMGTYCNLFNYLQIYNQIKTVENPELSYTEHPETCLGYHCTYHGLKFIKQGINAVLRPYGSVDNQNNFLNDFGTWGR